MLWGHRLLSVRPDIVCVHPQYPGYGLSRPGRPGRSGGVHDNHRRIEDGTLDFGSFLTWFRKYTPQADLVVEYGMETADDCLGIEADVERLLKI